MKEIRPLTVSSQAWESLTRSDYQLLQRLDREGRIEVAGLGLDCEHVLWLVYYGFVLLDIDFKDQIFLVRNPETTRTLRRKAS